MHLTSNSVYNINYIYSINSLSIVWKKKKYFNIYISLFQIKDWQVYSNDAAKVWIEINHFLSPQDFICIINQNSNEHCHQSVETKKTKISYEWYLS